MKNRNKKGESLLPEETVKIVIAVVGISFLLFMAYSVYGMFKQDSKVEQAKASLERLSFSLEKVEKGESALEEVIIESPDDWWILAWPYKENPNKPEQCKKDYCVCICDIPTVVSQANSLDKCNSGGVCRDVSIKIKTISSFGNAPLDIREITSVKIYLENGEIIIEK